MDLLKELCQAPGIPGREQAVMDIMKRGLGQSCASVRVDDIGNVVGHKPGRGGKRILIAAHMDEIGFVVSHIDKDGFIRFGHRGGHVPRVALSQRVRIYGKERVTGIIEGSPAFLARPDQRNKIPELKELFIDTGMRKEELEKIVGLGDIIVTDGDWREQGKICISKAMDDRVGCYVLLETMKRLGEVEAEVYAVGTSQEEVGLRGAYLAGKTIEPDFGIALDVTGAFDTPGVAEHQQVSRLGKGTAIKINDQASISNHGVVEFLKELAEKHDIPHQLEVLPFGGTDAGAIQRMGKGAVATLSIPSRYVHSPNEMVHRDDVEATIRLLQKFIEECARCELKF